MRVYLDNCCYNRPYDDQAQIKIALETQAKLHIQELIGCGKIELAASFMLRYECGANPFAMRREAIFAYVQENASFYVGTEHQEEIEKKAEKIMLTGIKYKDAVHVACAIFAGCDFFISTDKRLLKFQSDEIRLVSPIEFVIETEVD